MCPMQVLSISEVPVHIMPPLSHLSLPVYAISVTLLSMCLLQPQSLKSSSLVSKLRDHFHSLARGAREPGFEDLSAYTPWWHVSCV